MALRVGVAGFDYPDWEGVVYPPHLPRGPRRLAWLAGYLDLVELNNTFYRIPPPRSAERWAAAVEPFPAFSFTAKLHRGFTHQEEDPQGGQVAAFRDAVAPLRDRGVLLAVLVQFPWSFQDGPSARSRLARLAEAFAGLPLALEVRHGSFAAPEALAHVRALGYSLVSPDMPSSRTGLPLHTPRTGPLAYLRLHGRNRAAWFRKDAGRDQRYDHLYSPRELDDILAVARQAAPCATETLVVANNHFRGQALANALEILAALTASPVPVPDTLLAAYPRLRSIAAPTPRQHGLFG